MKRPVSAAFLTVVLAACAGCPPSAAPPSSSLPPEPAARAAAAPVQSGVAIAVVIDTSGSMDGERISVVKSAWRNVLAPKLDAYQKDFDRLETVLVRCGGNSEILSPLAKYAPGVDGVVAGLSADGGTPLGESMTVAYREVARSPRERKHVFILTDGQANGSVSPGAVLKAMSGRGEKIKVWLLGFHSDKSYYKDFEDAGATVLMADDQKALEAACASIFDEILKLEKD